MLTARCLSRSGFVEHPYDPYTHTYTQDLTLVSSLRYPSGIRQADREQAYTVQRDHQVPKAGWSHILLRSPTHCWVRQLGSPGQFRDTLG